MPPRRPAKSRSRLVVISLSVVVGLAIAGVGGWFGLQWWRARETARIRTEAFADFDAGRFEEALLPLSRVVSRDADKKDVEAIRRLAKARLMVPELNNAHIPQAARFFAAAIAADPNDVEAHRELLKLEFGMRRLVEAERTAEALLRLDPSDSTATQLLARMLVIKDDRAGAESLLTKRVREHPKDIDAKVQLWQLWMQTKRSPDDCIADIDRWLTEPDADPSLRVMRAERLRAAGRMNEVRAELDSIVDLQPRSFASCRLVARAFARIGRMDVARRILADGARSIGGAEGSQAAFELFQVGWLANDLDMAAEGVAIGATDITARWTGRAGITVAFLRDDAKALDEAVAAFKPTGAKASADLDFATALPLVLAGLKDPAGLPKANAAIERALASNPEDPVLLYAQYELRLAAGDRGSAIAAGAKAFEASGNAWVRIGVALVPAIESYGDRARAKAILDQLAETQGSHPNVQMLLVLASADAVSRGEAPVIPEKEYANLARSLERQADTNPPIAPIAVLSLATSGQQARAKAVINRVLDDPASRGELLLELARIVRQSKLDEGAEGTARIDRLLAVAAERGVPPVQIEAFRAMGSAGTESLPALLALADGGNVAALRTAAALAELRFPEQAPAILERLLKEDPSAEGLSIVLNSQASMGNPALLEQAIAAAERLEGGRGDSTAIPRARLLIAKGNPSRADLDASLAELDELRQRRGETSELLAAMTTLLLASDPPDITAAARLAGKAATLAPDRGQLQLLAAALFRQAGNNDSATLYLQKAMASPGAKSDPRTRRGIIDEMRALGQSKPAAAEARGLAESTGLSGDWLVAANLSEVADEPPEVERCLKAAIAAPDATAFAWSRLASGLGRAGRIDEGRTVLQDLKTRNPEAVWLPIEVEFELAFGPREAAVARLDEAYAKYPDDPTLMLLKSRERVAARDTAAALEIARRAAATEATKLVARDIAILIVGEPDPVGGAAIDALAAAGGFAAEPLRELRKMRDGAEPPSATKALELARRVPQLWVVWAFALDVAQAAKDPTNRLVIAEEAVRSLPNDPRSLAAYSSILLDYGRPGEARDVAERLRILAKTSPEYRAPAVRFAALGQLGTGQAGRAKEMLVAFARESQDLDAIMLAAAIDAQLGNVDAAYARAKPVLATSDPALIFWMRLVGSLGPKEAKAALLAAAEHESRMPNYFASAWILASGRDDPAGLDRAARLIESARTAGKPALETAAVAFELAAARNDAAQIEQARTALAAELNEAARELLAGKTPSTALSDAAGIAAADAITTEAKALLDRGRDLERAQRLLEAAVAAQGTPDQRVALARAMAARGQADAAAETALRLTREFPAMPDAWVALARARLAERDREGALTAVEEGRKAVTSSFFVAPKVKAELEAMAGAISAMSNRD